MADTHFSGVDTPILKVNGTVIAGTGVTPIPDLDITWSSNEPTAASTQTISDGDLVAGTEIGQAIANLTAKVNAILAHLGL